MTDQAAPTAPFYKNPDYLFLVSAQGLSLTGRQIETIVLPLLILGLTGSPVQVGLIDPTRLPVAGAESARKVLDPNVPANGLMRRAGL